MLLSLIKYEIHIAIDEIYKHYRTAVSLMTAGDELDVKFEKNCDSFSFERRYISMQ